MASIEQEILTTLREILVEVREIRRNLDKPSNPQQLLNEQDYLHDLKRLKQIRETFAKFPGEDNGTD